jgi:hypothetical protein
MRPLPAIVFVALLASTTTAQDGRAGARLAACPVEPTGGHSAEVPKDAERNITPEYCQPHEWPVSSPEELAVASAGWIVFAYFLGGNDLSGGGVSEDGMCRPYPYQHVVFVQGKFAGTLLPRLMRARSDATERDQSYARKL